MAVPSFAETGEIQSISSGTDTTAVAPSTGLVISYSTVTVPPSAGMNVLPQRQLIAGNGAVVACLRGENAVQRVCDGGAGVNVLPQRQLIAGNAAVVAKWEGVEWEQMFGPALGLFTGGSAISPPSDGVWS